MTEKAYSFIGSYKEGRVLATRTNSQGLSLYGYLNKQGNEVIPLNYKEGTDFREGKAVVKINEGQYALINLNGQIIRNYKYAFVGQLS